VFDSNGNIYGATSWGGVGVGGTLFRLLKHSDGSFTYQKVYNNFSASRTPECGGFNAMQSLVIDSSNYIYGTTEFNGYRRLAAEQSINSIPPRSSDRDSKLKILNSSTISAVSNRLASFSRAPA
jgi:hypothetical protein